MRIDIDRTQVLAYRAAAHGLCRDARDPADLAVFDLGVQDSQAGTARLALAARLPCGYTDPLAADDRFALLWTFRGAPHLHRRADLPALAAALWPRGEGDAAVRLGAWGKDAGDDALTVFATTVRAMRDAVRGPMTKGEVSAAVTARIPPGYSYDCRSCRARHVYGSLFQQVALPAGVRLVPDASPATLAVLEDRPPVPVAADGTDAVVRAYLRLHGPAALAHVAGYLGTRGAQIRDAWPDGLIEVRVDGRRAWIPEENLEALRTAAPPRLVRLLPTLDPYLQARDRDLLVPDKTRQRALWRILGSPGALYAHGEIAGAWRARMAGRGRLDVSVQPFGALPTSIRTAVEEEAQRVAEVRGAANVQIHYEEP